MRNQFFQIVEKPNLQKKVQKPIVKFSPAFFKRRRIPKAAPWSQSADCEISLLFKDQEGSQNNSVNCFGVGNPIKGFPEIFEFVHLTKMVYFFDKLKN